MHVRRSALVLTAALALGACGEREDPRIISRSLTDGEIAVTVNDSAISTLQVARHAAQRAGADSPADQQTALQELINLQLLSEQAVRNGLHRDKAVAEELQRQRIAVLADAFVRQQVAAMQISDSDLQQEYDEQMAQVSDREYLASHIVVADQTLARELIVQLNGGGDFAALARDHSTGPSAEDGGRMDWFRGDQMMPAFTAAVAGLAIGETTDVPVHTRFGWHVIRLDNARNVEKPALDQVSDRLRVIIRNKRLRDLVEELRAAAAIAPDQAPAAAPDGGG